MFDPDHWRKLPSGKGSMAILQRTGIIVFRETHKNGLYMQGSGELFFDAKDIEFAQQEYQAWLAASNSPPPPGTVVLS